MDNGFHFKYLWSDSELYELRVVAWDGRFGGTADLYEPIGGLKESADKLKGFPSTLQDVREVAFGTLSPDYGGGGISLRFFCTDAAGHAMVEAKIQCKDPRGLRMPNSAHFFSSVEPASLDRFVDELRNIETNNGGSAFLAVAGP